MATMLIIGASAEDTNINICNSLTLPNSAWPGKPSPTLMYARYIRYLYSVDMSADGEPSMPSHCDNVVWLDGTVKVVVPQEVKDTLLWIPTLVMQELMKKCQDARDALNRLAKGVDLVVVWPSVVPKPSDSAPSVLGKGDTAVMTHTASLRHSGDGKASHTFVSKGGTSTVWTKVYVSEQPTGFSPLYQLPPEFFTDGIEFSAQGFAGMEDYIAFSPSVRSKYLFQVQQSGSMAWGLLTKGCRPPVFTITVSWKQASDCARPRVMVTQISEDESFACAMQFSSGDPQLDASLLMTLAYAVSPWNGRISISSAQAQAITSCLVPSASSFMQFSYWGKWTLDAPGMCMPCTQMRLTSSGAAPVQRVCNRTAGESGDCCFTCARGYQNLPYTDPNTKQPQQHCVATCSRGYIYDNPAAFMPRCVACPPGKHSYPDGLRCGTCMELGFGANAYAQGGSRGGCKECGARAYATGDTAACPGCYVSCTGCPAQMYVPPDEAKCRYCPSGWVLRTQQSAECSPCAPGLYALDGRCVLCSPNRFTAVEGSTGCSDCAGGYEAALNRTACVPCPDLGNRSNLYAIYRQDTPGCNAICNRSVAYPQGTNAFAPDGCVPCARLAIPAGMYARQDDCAQFLPCVNVPAPNSTSLLQYTGSGNARGICPWQCRPGWYLVNGNACASCASAGFNASLHAYTAGCALACLPGLFYRGPRNDDISCTQRCVRLDDELLPRCSDYFVFLRSNGTRVLRRTATHSYVTGFCGSNLTDATSTLGVARHRGVFGAAVSGSGACGDSMLWPVTVEECDDGNTIGGDGCSATCKIERDGYWDCDLLGEPCLPDCGWRQQEGLLQGYALPAPPPFNMPWCTGIAYVRDYLMDTPLSARAAWLQSRMVPCQCAGNPYQSLPYSECNYTNRGCRQCLPGQFQDDLYGRCSPCGSVCALGFRPRNGSSLLQLSNNEEVAFRAKYGVSSLNLCSPDIATSQDLSFADPVLDPLGFGRDQLKLGCIPCTAGALNSPTQVIFTTSDCRWICRRDYSNVSEPKYYCKTPLLMQPSTGLSHCNAQCLDCALSLSSLKRPDSTFGWYIRSCADGVGHEYARCPNLTDPNALFTGDSPLVGDSTGCPWACKSGFQMVRGRCMQCDTVARMRFSCVEGEILRPCDGSAGNAYYCAPCALVMPSSAPPLPPLYVWSSKPSAFTECAPICEPGVAYQGAPNETCAACSHQECALYERRVPCNATMDTQCLACPPLLPEQHLEFYSPGTCGTRCTQGYAWTQDDGCVACSLQVVCAAGQRRSSECQRPEDRLAPPICVPCDPIDVPSNRPSPGRMWDAKEECTTTCSGGWMFAGDTNRTCVPCNTTRCSVGEQGACVAGQVVCTPCDWQALAAMNRVFTRPGDCTITACAPGYGGPSCEPPPPRPQDWLDRNATAADDAVSSPDAIRGVSLRLKPQADSNKTSLASQEEEPVSFPRRMLPHS